MSWARPGRVLDYSWASWSAFGRLLGCLGPWVILGGSLGTLGRLWLALVRQVGAKMDPKGPRGAKPIPRLKTPQKSRPRWSKIALICKTIFRNPFWGLWRSLEEPWKLFGKVLGRFLGRSLEGLWKVLGKSLVEGQDRAVFFTKPYLRHVF